MAFWILSPNLWSLDVHQMPLFAVLWKHALDHSHSSLRSYPLPFDHAYSSSATFTSVFYPIRFFSLLVSHTVRHELYFRSY